MEVIDGTKADLELAIPLFRKFFPKHNIFHGKETEILPYLENLFDKNKLLLIKEGGKILAACFLVKTGESLDKTHFRWKFRHLAFVDDASGLEILYAAEKEIMKLSKTCKIELTIAETESQLNFYQKFGYDREGVLRNHYRWGETTFILSKSFKKASYEEKHMKR